MCETPELFQVQFPRKPVHRVGSEVKADDLKSVCDLFQKKHSNTENDDS